MSELFDLPEVLSPRLAWIKRNNISIRLSVLTRIDEPRKYLAYTRDQSTAIGTGQTEDEALTDLAKLLGVPLWNEERFIL